MIAGIGKFKIRDEKVSVKTTRTLTLRHPAPLPQPVKPSQVHRELAHHRPGGLLLAPERGTAEGTGRQG